METITQGQQEKDNSGIVQFDPNTGARLSAGQTVTIKPAKPISPSISTEQIGTAPLNIREPQPQGEAAGLSEFITGTNNTYKTQRDQEIDQREQVNQDYMTEISNVFGEQAGLSQKGEDILKEEGADEAKKQADEYASQIEAEQLAIRRKVEDMRKRNPNRVFGDAMEANIVNLERDSLSKQADLAILQNAAVRKYDTAKAIADRKIAMETESLKNRMEALQFFYQDNRDQLTKKQDQAYQEAIKQADREYNEQLAQKTTIENAKLNLLQNGAPQSLLAQVSAAKTTDDLTKISGLGYYMMSPLDRINIAIKQNELNVARDAADAAKQAKASGQLTPSQYEKATDLRKEYNGLAEVKAAKESEVTTSALLNALAAKNPKSDISAINSFQRIAVDPGVAVREGDVALLRSASSFGDQTWLRTQGFMRGNKLTDQGRKEMQDLATKIHDARINYATDQTAPIRLTTQGYGIDFDKYVGTPFASSNVLLQRVQGQQVAPEQQFNSYLDTVTKSFTGGQTQIIPTPFDSLFRR